MYCINDVICYNMIYCILLYLLYCRKLAGGAAGRGGAARLTLLVQHNPNCSACDGSKQYIYIYIYIHTYIYMYIHVYMLYMIYM